MDIIPCQSFVLSHLVIASVQNMHQVNLFGTSVRQPEFADDYFFAEGVKTTRSNRLNFRLPNTGRLVRERLKINFATLRTDFPASWM